MKGQEKFSFKKRLESFKYAFSGLATLFKEEHNARIHLVFALAAIALGFVFSISVYEWIAILLCVALVFSLEIVNSAIENLADRITKDNDSYIRKAKDLAAAAVLVAAIFSVIIGAIIFLPKLLDLI
ncbi:diacylglycerol kinase family protein [Dysgonomonas sp. 520]|uniref:diacylglycerol kinase family protein n=1 Tax=Dysgonomonas sp. 520 TaxID=2302931 RepID=UPI0013D7BF00|nr:diacylglycerol kinase family protein [Dysgonomonas sp. 520]NDW08087.1 diacylglycerol kinase family protein [Dysgonomonas sp. 520]